MNAVPRRFQYDRDPGDEFVVNLALEANAEYLITRDRDLLDLMGDATFREGHRSLSILDPVDFLRELARLREPQAVEVSTEAEPHPSPE